jgi:type III secretory pathway component EscV
MRFVKGDAIAQLVIVGVALVGGIAVGVLRQGLPFGEAAERYALLAVGDGLVSLLPALLLSTASGLVVTRAAAGPARPLGALLVEQLAQPEALLWAAGLMALLGLVPGLPLVPLTVTAVLLGAGAWRLSRRPATRTPTGAIEPSPVPALTLRLSSASLADDDLARRLQGAARRVADSLGVPIPAPTVAHSAEAAAGQWELRLRGQRVAEGLLPEGRLLAEVGPAELPEGFAGEPTEHPRTGALATWVTAADGPALRQRGVPLLEPREELPLRLERALRRLAPELLGIDETARLLDEVATRAPALVREAVPRRIELGGLTEVLRRLLAEGEPLGDLRDVLEALCRLRELEGDPALVVERVRAQLARPLTLAHLHEGRIEALLLASEAEELLRESLRPASAGPLLALEPELAQALVASVRLSLEAHPHAVLVVPAELRRHLRRLVEVELPQLAVLAPHELLPEAEVARVGVVQAF